MSLPATIPHRPSATATKLSFRRSITTRTTANILQDASHSLPFHRVHCRRYSFSPPMAMRKRSPKRLKYSSQRLYKKDNGDDKLLYVEMDSSGGDSWKLDTVVDLIKAGGVGVIPTDTVYAIVCNVNSHSSIERLRRLEHFLCLFVSFFFCRIKDIEKTKPLSILCHSLKDIDTYTMGFPRGNDHGQTNIFRAVKNCLPGPYTFILRASKALPKQCIRHGSTTTYTTRKNVGVRIPDDSICQAILEKLEGPLISTSVKWPTEDRWMIDPVEIADIYDQEGLDFVVNGGIRAADPSTVVDMSGSTPTIIRQGKGPKYHWMVASDEERSTDEDFSDFQRQA